VPRLRILLRDICGWRCHSRIHCWLKLAYCSAWLGLDQNKIGLYHPLSNMAAQTGAAVRCHRGTIFEVVVSPLRLWRRPLRGEAQVRTDPSSQNIVGCRCAFCCHLGTSLPCAPFGERGNCAFVPSVVTRNCYQWLHDKLPFQKCAWRIVESQWNELTETFQRLTRLLEFPMDLTLEENSPAWTGRGERHGATSFRRSAHCRCALVIPNLTADLRLN